jgi:hypothetical protein
MVTKVIPQQQWQQSAECGADDTIHSMVTFAYTMNHAGTLGKSNDLFDGTFEIRNKACEVEWRTLIKICHSCVTNRTRTVGRIWVD